MYNYDDYYGGCSYPYFNSTPYVYAVAYELFASGSYDIKYSNKTVKFFAYQAVDNSTASERRWIT